MTFVALLLVCQETVYREPFANFRLRLPEGWNFGATANPMRFDGTVSLVIERAVKVEADKKLKIGGYPARKEVEGTLLRITIDAGDRAFVLSYNGADHAAAEASMRSIRIFPEHPFSEERKKEFEELSKLNAWEKIRDLFPNYPEALARVGESAINASDWKKAADALQKAVKLDPDESIYLFNFARALVPLNRLAEAEKAMQKATELKPNSEAECTMYGYVLYLEKNYKKAETVLRRSIQLDPKSTLAYYNLGAVYEAEKRWAEAEECYQTALQLKPGDRDLQTAVGRVRQQRK